MLRSKARSGYEIAGRYVSRIENGIARDSSKDKLIGLAKGLGVPEEEVFAVARGKSLDETHCARAKATTLGWNQ
jgi:transcriptional regulator with XRE-family HTH domain